MYIMETIVQIGTLGLDALHLGFIALALGALIWLYVYANGVKQETIRKEERALSLEIALDNQLQNVENAIQEAKTQRLRAETAEKQVAAAGALETKTKEQFESLAQAVLAKNQEQFMALANETFSKHKEGAKGDLQELMKPIGENFAEFKKRVEAIEKVRSEDKSAIGEQIKNLVSDLHTNRETTSKLVTALSAPKGAGQWGEESLERALEYAGLTKYVDFDTQVSINNDRPDALINLPNNRSIIIDAKVSSAEFLKATQDTDPARQKEYMLSHAKHVRANMKRLADKAYQTRISETADFVVMYIPGENMFSAAVTADPSLFQDGFRQNVIIASPSTLVALAKTVALGWREEQLAQSAKEVQALGEDLYRALKTFGTKVQSVGTNLGRSVRSYNELVGSLESNVMPKGRKFEKLGASPEGLELNVLDHVDEAVRQVNPNKDLQLDIIDAITSDKA